MKKTMISFLAMALGVLNFGLAVTMATAKISHCLSSETEVTSKFIDALNSNSERVSKIDESLNSDSERTGKIIDGLNSKSKITDKSVINLDNTTCNRLAIQDTTDKNVINFDNAPCDGVALLETINKNVVTFGLSARDELPTQDITDKSVINLDNAPCDRQSNQDTIDKSVINLDNAICNGQELLETTNKNVVESGLAAYDELPTQTITDKNVINLDNTTCDGLSNHDTTDKGVINLDNAICDGQELLETTNKNVVASGLTAHDELPTQTITDKSVINLDCTLRDGGYVNDGTFGEKNIPEIRSNLAEDGVDMIECGYFSPFAKEDKDKAVYNSLEKLDKILDSHPNAKFCALLRYKEGIEEFIPECTLKNIKLIRISFQYGEAEGAINLCKSLMQKGYKVSYQPANTPGYSLDELKEMLEMVNELKPYSFYIVDTLGILQKDKLLELFYFIDKALVPEISLGYHSHNNLQLAFSNAQTLVGLGTKRKLIIDSSVFGMGRGAGNLCTELLLHHLNEKHGAQYKLEPLYKIFENNISDVYKKSPWGYSLPRFISAKNTCSADYSAHLNKRNMKLADIDETLSRLPQEKRTVFNEKALLEVIA